MTFVPPVPLPRLLPQPILRLLLRLLLLPPLLLPLLLLPSSLLPPLVLLLPPLVAPSKLQQGASMHQPTFSRTNRSGSGTQSRASAWLYHIYHLADRPTTGLRGLGSVLSLRDSKVLASRGLARRNDPSSAAMAISIYNQAAANWVAGDRSGDPPWPASSPARHCPCCCLHGAQHPVRRFLHSQCHQHQFPSTRYP